MQERSDQNQPLFYEILGPEVTKDRIPLYELIESLKEGPKGVKSVLDALKIPSVSRPHAIFFC